MELGRTDGRTTDRARVFVQMMMMAMATSAIEGFRKSGRILISYHDRGRLEGLLRSFKAGTQPSVVAARMSHIFFTIGGIVLKFILGHVRSC